MQKAWGRSAVGSALQWHCRGRGFESLRLHQMRGHGPRVFLNIIFLVSLVVLASTTFAVEFLSTTEHNVAARLIELLDTAEQYVLTVSYSLDHQEVIDKLNELFLSGVHVVAMIDASSSGRTVLCKPLFEVRADSSDGLMHAKLIVIDGKIAVFGTGNITQSGLHRDSNTFLVFDDFDHVLLLEDYALALLEGKKLEMQKVPNGVFIMTPSEKGRQLFLNTILKAKEEICFLSYAFTDTELLALLKYKSAKGVSVRGIIDHWNNDFSTIARYLNTGIMVTSPPDDMRIHDKTIIIDGRTVITGSANHSFNAWQKNREVVAIIESADLATKYLAHFAYLWEVAQYGLKSWSCPDQYYSGGF